MPNFLQKIFSRAGIYILRILFVFGFLSLFAVTFASTIPNAGTIYEKWIVEFLVQPPQGENGLTTALQNPTVQRAHALADNTGKEISWATQDKFLIGEDSVSNETVKIAGENASLQISAISGNPEISLGDMNGAHGSLYLDSTSGNLRVWNTENGIDIGENVDFPVSLHGTSGKSVTVFACENGKFLQGFDDDANPICGIKGGKIAWVSSPIGQCSKSCGGGEQLMAIKCRDGSDNFNIVDDQQCIDANLEKPLSTNPCNVHACPVKTDGGWSSWKASGNCIAATGKEVYTRTCTSPIPYRGGNNCSALDGGNNEKEENCLVD